MQQDSLNQLEMDNLSDEEQEKIFDELKKRAASPMGVALTQVLLSLNQENKKLNLRDFPEMLPNICLAGMNFRLNGVSEIARDLSGLNLNGADFRGAVLEKVIFQKSNLRCTKLDNAILRDANLQDANLEWAKLRRARLDETNFQNTDICYADLRNSQLNWKKLKKSKNITCIKINKYDFIEQIYPDWKKENGPQWRELEGNEQGKVIDQFCSETLIRIFNKDGKRIGPPFWEYKT